MRNIDYYEILGISADAAKDEIIKGYRERAKDYHPDRVAHLGEELQFHARRRYLLISEARETLLDPQKREEFNRNLAKIKESHISVPCPSCGVTNRLPRQLRPGIIRCRSCSGDLGITGTASAKVDKEQLVPLLTAALLTMRNIYYTKSVELALVLDFEGIQLEVRNFIHGEKSQSPDLFGVVNNQVLHELLAQKLNYKSEPWDPAFSSGWIFFPKGDDRELATNLTNLLVEFIQIKGEVSLQFTDFQGTGRWDHWAGVFLLTSIYDISPWRAARELERNHGELLAVSKGLPPHEGILNNLKYNWKIFLMVSSLSPERPSLEGLERELRTIKNAVTRAENLLGS